MNQLFTMVVCTTRTTIYLHGMCAYIVVYRSVCNLRILNSCRISVFKRSEKRNRESERGNEETEPRNKTCVDSCEKQVHQQSIYPPLFPTLSFYVVFGISAILQYLVLYKVSKYVNSTIRTTKRSYHSISRDASHCSTPGC